MSTRRILIYCDEYPPAKSGGIGSVTKIIAEALAKQNHYVLVAGSYEYGSTSMETTEINGVRVYRFSYFNFLRFFPKKLHRSIKGVLRKLGVLSNLAKADLLRNEKMIAELLNEHQIEVIELVDYIALLKEIKQPIGLQTFNIPTTLRIHGSVSFLNINKGIQHEQQLKNDRLNFNRAKQLSAVSQYAADFVNNNLLSTQRFIHVIYNPIEGALLKKSKQTSNNTILFIGKLTHTKGAFQVIKAFQAIAHSYPEWKLVLLGGGEELQAKQIIQPEFQNRIVITGYVQRSEVLAHIEASDFVVIPSYFENFSMVPLEVMAKQKAVIYTKRTSGPEIITDSQNGLLVEPDNLDEIIDKMTLLMEQPAKRMELATNGFHTVQTHFTTDRIVHQLVTHYQSLINE